MSVKRVRARSMGMTTATMPLGYKWLLILAMALGRIEILAAFKALSSTPIIETVKGVAGRLRRKIEEFLARK